MDHNEKEPERLYKVDEIRMLRTQFDKLADSVGRMDATMKEVKTAITGNDMGTAGLVGEVERAHERMDAIEVRMNGMDDRAKDDRVQSAQRNFYIRVIWLLIGSGATGLFIEILHAVFTKK